MQLCQQQEHDFPPQRVQSRAGRACRCRPAHTGGQLYLKRRKIFPFCFPEKSVFCLLIETKQLALWQESPGFYIETVTTSAEEAGALGRCFQCISLLTVQAEYLLRPWKWATGSSRLLIYFWFWSGIQKFVFVTFSLLIRCDPKNPSYYWYVWLKAILATGAGPKGPGGWLWAVFRFCAFSRKGASYWYQGSGSHTLHSAYNSPDEFVKTQIPGPAGVPPSGGQG